MSDVQYLAPYGVGQPGSVEGGAQTMVFRDRLDAARSGMAGFVPSAEYPDGYLGTIQSRRQDRFLDSLKGQINQRSYQRGVHKGERIDAADYFWPGELQPDRGIRNEMRAVPTPDGTWLVRRQAPLGTVSEQMSISGGREVPTTPRGKLKPPPTVYEQGNPAVVAALRAMAPTWR